MDYGMICEWNPLHTGHERLIREARKRGAERIVCVMSGNTVQRGEFAVADRYLRAEAAIRCGVDLVLELPFPFCSGSAESFAKGGISILRHFCDRVIFGSECGDLSLLVSAAAVSEDPAFREAYRLALSEGEGSASAYARLLADRGIHVLSSNDLLGVEYIRQSRALGCDLSMETVCREGLAYGERELTEGQYPSATALRGLWEKGRYEEANAYLPPEAAEVFARGRAEGRMLSSARLENVILSYFRLREGSEFDGILGCGGGLGNRICRIARSVTTLSELYEELGTKRYTDAALQRTLLYCLLGVTPEDMEGLPVYTTVLGANERGRAMLREAMRRLPEDFSVVTKPADAPKEARQTLLAQKADGIYTLCTEVPRDAYFLMKRSPYMA